MARGISRRPRMREADLPHTGQHTYMSVRAFADPSILSSPYTSHVSVSQRHLEQASKTRRGVWHQFHPQLPCSRLFGSFAARLGRGEQQREALQHITHAANLATPPAAADPEVAHNGVSQACSQEPAAVLHVLPAGEAGAHEEAQELSSRRRQALRMRCR